MNDWIHLIAHKNLQTVNGKEGKGFMGAQPLANDL